MAEKKKVDQNQAIIVVFVLVTLAVTIGVAMMMGGRQKGDGLQSSQRFTAKPGTTRENAVALSSSKRQTEERGSRGGLSPGSGSGDADEIPVTENEKPLRVRSLSPEEEEPASDKEVAIRAALNDLNPGRGIEKLRELLEGELTDDERSRAHSAIAQLCGQLDTPDPAQQEEALNLAASYARSPAAIVDAAQDHAAILAAQGKVDAAAERLQSAMGNLDAATPERATLGVLLGGLKEANGDAAGAEDAYAAAFKDATEIAGGEQAQREDLLRQTGLRLSRMYRAGGRAAEADQVANQMGEALAAAASQP